MNLRSLAAVPIILALVGVVLQPVRAGTFGEEVEFLQAHTQVIVLGDKLGRARVAVSPAWQGRVLTSTAGGNDGASFGWLNHDFIASGKLVPHMNVFGGEDRFWIGPEGGQFSVFFSQGATFDLADWFTPAAVDTLPFQVANKSLTAATFTAAFVLTNYSGTRFDVRVKRTVRLLEPAAAWQQLQVASVKGVSLVAYETDNQLSNAGQNAWTKETGLLSIWILGQFNPSPATTIVVPIKAGSERDLGVKVTSDYFGSIPPDRLVVKDDVLFFSGDGQYRSKIGVNPGRSKAILGSYDAENKVLTLVRFNQPADVADYVNSLWKLQDHPFSGDAINSYNDGSPSPGAKSLGAFYEMESSSPAAALAPGQSISHVRTTLHLSGSEPDLDAVARATLGVSLAEIQTALKH